MHCTTNYYEPCQKTIYHTIYENTQQMHEVDTATFCECLMLTRPSKNILHQCDIIIKTEESIYWNQIPLLNARIFSTRNPKPISITHQKGKTEKIHLIKSGLLRLGTECTAKTEHTTLIGTQINKNFRKLIYNLDFSQNNPKFSR